MRAQLLLAVCTLIFWLIYSLHSCAAVKEISVLIRFCVSVNDVWDWFERCVICK